MSYKKYWAIRAIAMVMSLSVLLPGNSVTLAEEPATPESSPAVEEVVSFALFPAGGHDGVRFEMEAEPGNIFEENVAIQNSGTVPLTLKTYTADVVHKVNGGFDMAEEGGEQHQPTTWMTYPTETLELQPGEEANRTLKIAIPEDASPGQYINGLAIQTAESLEIEGSDSYRQVLRKYIPVIITIPGPIEPGFALGQPRIEHVEQGMAIRAQISNTGNALVQPVGELVVKDEMGNALITAPVEMATIYPGLSALLELMISQPLPPGNYLLSLSLIDETSGVTATIADQVVEVSEAPQPAMELPVEVISASIVANTDPIQFADVNVGIQNNGQLLQATSLTLLVSRDGEPVEEFALSQDAQLATGANAFSTRYIPASGFESGMWTFSFRLESVDSNGVTTLLLSTEDVATIEVP